MTAIEMLRAECDALDALKGWTRTVALIRQAKAMAPCLGTLLILGDADPIGRIHREAWRALSAARAADTPARSWAKAFNAKDRRTICHHLKIDPAEPTALFATFPFRVIQHDARPWIAGAIGCERLHDAASIRAWEHIDITDVILWNPRTGETRLADDDGPALVECADYEDGRYTIYGDGFAFFRAWADRRAEIAGRISAARAAKRQIPREPIDSGLPGALAIGDLDQITWRDLGATTLVAGPGTDPAALKRAVYRAANLPRVEAPDHRRAA